MEFKLEAKKYQDRVAELESAVDNLQHELALLSRQAETDAGNQTLSDSEMTPVADQTNANNTESTSAQQQEVNV